MVNKNDFRYKATEDSINKAFMQLASGKRACEVSVSELCRQAGISRNAFYLHYSGIADLCHTLIDELMSEIEQECLASAAKVLATESFDWELPSAIFDTFESHEELIRALMSADSGETSCYLASSLERIYADAATAFGMPYETREHRLMCAFDAWAHIGFFKQWIAETEQPFAEARPCFIKLYSQSMKPHYQLLTDANAARASS